MLTYLVAFLLSMGVAALATPIVLRVAEKRQWLDLPVAGRKIHTRAVPRLGGVAVVTAFFCPLAGLAVYTNRISLLLYDDARLVFALIAGGAAIVALGIWDDLRGADAKLKLTVQSLTAIGMWLAGFRVEELGVPFGSAVQLGLLSLPLTALWIVGVVNALNLIDGLDGLASGIALFAAVVLFGVAFADNEVLLCLFMATLAGALIGFLFFNFNPARIFLGDSGSMFLGFILATMSIWTQRKGATAVALIVPVLALGVPILDTALSVVRRLGKRQNPFKADREHLHHKLLALGLSHRAAVYTLYTMSAIFALGALAMLDNDTTHRAIALSTVAMVTVILVRRLGVFHGPERRAIEDAAADRLREDVRRTARRIREAEGLDAAWDALCEVLPSLGLERLRLSAVERERDPSRGLCQRVYEWKKEPAHGAVPEWVRGPLPARLRCAAAMGLRSPSARCALRLLEREIRFDLDEAGVHYGELCVVDRPGGPEARAIGLELLRDAWIDLSVRARELERASEAGVVRKLVPLARSASAGK